MSRSFLIVVISSKTSECNIGICRATSVIRNHLQTQSLKRKSLNLLVQSSVMNTVSSH